MLATRKLPLQPLLPRKRMKRFRRGLPYLGAHFPRRGHPVVEAEAEAEAEAEVVEAEAEVVEAEAESRCSLFSLS